MAYKPKAVKLKNDSTTITNAVLNEVSKTYPLTPSLRINPAASEEVQQSQRHQIGEFLSNDLDLSNAFIKNLINRIVMVIFQSIYFTNPWKRFKRGYLEAGDVVEEIAFDLCKPNDYDSTEDREYPKQVQEKVYTAFHKLNYQKYYKRTINRDKLLQAFTTREGMHELAQYMLSIMYVSAEYDEYISMKYMIGRHSLNGEITMMEIPEPAPDTMKSIAAQIKGLSNNMTLINFDYNFAHLPTNTEKRNQIILINTNFDAQLDVEVLAIAFNMDKADIEGQRVFINDWTMDEVQRMNLLFQNEDGYTPFTAAEIEKLNKIPLFVLDERFFMVFDYLMEMTEFFNPEKLYWNYWLHTWKILSVSGAVNAVGLTYVPIGAASIDISPATVTLKTGSSMQFTATMTGTGFLPSTVTWSVSGNQSMGTTIANGLLTIGTDETATTLTVTASCAGTENTTVTSSATVTINNG